MGREDGAAEATEPGPERSSRITEIGARAREEVPPRSTSDDALHPVDAELLEHLERRFSELSGADRLISVAELGRALNLRSEELARRVLTAFDRDHDGHIDAGDFLGSVRRLLLGSARDRLLFAFRVHDIDGDSSLTREELTRMIALGLAEDAVTYPAGEPARLAALLLDCADRNHDGRLSFDEFSRAIEKHAETLRHVTTSGACWLAPNEALLGPESPGHTRRVRLGRWVENHAVAIVLLSAWAIANAVLFEQARATWARAQANVFIQIARGSAACVYLNAALVLFPTMRGVLTFLQERRRSRAISFGSALGFHRLVGATLFGLALVHCAAHLGNLYVTDRAHLFSALVAPGARRSGVAWMGVFVVMWVFALKRVRRWRFDAFYLTHLLFPVWFGLGLAHGRAFAMWTAVPLLAYGVERLVRYVGRSYPADVLELRPLRSGVTRLTLARPDGFQAKAGQFVFLRLPAVAPHEWHPFTISSAPEQPELTLHVRALGDFSSAVRKLAEERFRNRNASPLVAELDGPYGAPCVDVFASRRVVLVAGGIGVTPFASVLGSIVCRLRSAPASLPLERIDFFWLNRDQYSFEWFVELLGRLTAMDENGLVHVHVFMTGGRADAACAALNLAVGMTQAAGGNDVVTGLGIETHMGEPAWAEELDAIVASAGGTPVDAYFCGPEGLGNKLSRLCRARGVDFRREVF